MKFNMFYFDFTFTDNKPKPNYAGKHLHDPFLITADLNRQLSIQRCAYTVKTPGTPSLFREIDFLNVRQKWAIF